MATLHILDVTGDTRITYQPVDTDQEFHEAQKIFAQKLLEGYMAFTVEPETKVKKVIYRFDETAVQIIMTPAVRGG